LAGFTAKDLAGMLDVSLRQVRRWREKGYLDGVNGRITEDSFARFCKAPPDKIPYLRLNEDVQLWLRSYNYQVRIGFKQKELADLLQVDRKTVRRWVARHWLQVCQNEVTEDSVRRFCSTHPDQITDQKLPSQTQLLLRRFGYPEPEASGSPQASHEAEFAPA
jgi:hypothetical protein